MFTGPDAEFAGQSDAKVIEPVVNPFDGYAYAQIYLPLTLHIQSEGVFLADLLFDGVKCHQTRVSIYVGPAPS